MKNNKTNLNAVDRRIYSYWQALYLAFFSSRLYVDVGKRWRGFGLSYLLLVISLAAIPLGLKSIRMFDEYYTQQLIEPIKKIPTFEVVRGRLVFPFFMPYFVKNQQNEEVIIIDDKPNLTEINYIYPHWMMFITTDRLYIRLPHLSFIPHEIMPTWSNYNSNNVSMQMFTHIPHAVFNSEAWTEHTNMALTKRYMLISIYPTLIFLLFGFFSILLWLMTVLGKAFTTTLFKFKIGFKRAFRLMVVSSSSVIGLFIMSLSLGRFPLEGLYLLIVIVMYFFFAVLSLKKESTNMVLA